MSENNPQLVQIIQEQINSSPEHKITFADYMDLVLYHPQYGYYNAKDINIGKSGDFFTASSLGSDFGELLAQQFVEMWEILGKPSSFDLVEMGAGKGELANDILSYLSQHYPDFLSAVHYHIIEQSSTLIEEQEKNLQSWQEKEIKITWKRWENIPEASLTGCFFSNELVDAFPVHRVQIEAGKLKEIYVTLASEQTPFPFQEVLGNLSTEELKNYFAKMGINLPSSAYEDGFQTEVNLAINDWLKQVSRCLDKGYLLTIDYGYFAEKYYHPQRSSGTLQCYYQHQRHNHPYYLIGNQDITAHVNFTALQSYGKQVNLQPLNFTRQALFLMALGLGNRLNTLSQGKFNAMQILQRRDALHQLIDPTGLGGFGVLLQGKALTEAEKAKTLQGFQETPFQS
ncbi:MAG: class I SAM-dependent methyltransferase [Cyanobacteriota bacterium]